MVSWNASWLDNAGMIKWVVGVQDKGDICFSLFGFTRISGCEFSLSLSKE